MNENKPNWGSLGFFDALLIAFIVLKLCHVIDWSWWWVLSPLWVSFIFVIVIVIIFGVIKQKD